MKDGALIVLQVLMYCGLGFGCNGSESAELSASSEPAPTGFQSSAASSQTTPRVLVHSPFKNPPSRAHLCLKMSPSRETALLGEPIYLTAELSNCSTEPIEVRELLAVEFGLLRLQIRRPNGDTQVYRPGIHKDGRGKRFRLLEAGDRITALVPIFFGRDGWVLDEPGIYQVEATLSLSGQRITAGPIQFEIESPSHQDDWSAARAMMSDAVGLELYMGSASGQAKALRRFTLEHEGASPWSDYAELAISTEALANEPDNETATETEHNLLEVLDPAVASQAAFRLISYYEDSRQYSAAERLRVAVRKKFNGSLEKIGWDP